MTHTLMSMLSHCHFCRVVAVDVIPYYVNNEEQEYNSEISNDQHNPCDIIKSQPYCLERGHLPRISTNDDEFIDSSGSEIVNQLISKIVIISK